MRHSTFTRASRVQGAEQTSLADPSVAQRPLLLVPVCRGKAQAGLARRLVPYLKAQMPAMVAAPPPAELQPTCTSLNEVTPRTAANMVQPDPGGQPSTLR